MKINKYYPFAFLYFFLNSVGLPLGLLYTTLLTPLLYLWVLIKGKRIVLLRFFLFLLPFVIVHLILGVQLLAYLKSVLLLTSVYIFGYAVYTFAERHYRWEQLFAQIVIINFALTLLAVFFYFSPYKSAFWTVNNISSNLHNFSRLSLFTYEPSYYSTLLAPLFLYFFARIFVIDDKLNLQMLALLSISLILSFSIGVLACLIFTMALFFLINYLKVLNDKKFLFYLLAIIALFLISLTALFIVAPHNPLFLRLNNILNNTDSSGKGRTFDAYQLAYLIAKLKSIWWGVGPGQLKIIGYETIIKFYSYPRNEILTVAIPCAMAETLAVFGILGSIIRVGLQIYLFFKTRVIHNYFCTLTFFFVFIYQFTGSYLTNVTEYTLWILTFCSFSFPDFSNRKRLFPTQIAT